MEDESVLFWGIPWNWNEYDIQFWGLEEEFTEDIISPFISFRSIE
jgi:hypothetical protein